MAHCVNIEVTEVGDLAETMSQIRSWLDDHNIEATGFSYQRADTGALIIDLCFASEMEASLFSDRYPHR